jgi:ABC-type transport system involved in multi-copper enzyme maturation permease subunit
MAYATAPAPVAPAIPSASGRAGLLNSVLSEWTKIRTLRSSYWTLGIMVVVSIGSAISLSAAASGHQSNSPSDAIAAVALLVFVVTAPVLTMLSGVMVMTSEYSHGMIRTTLTSQPRRLQVYLAKLIVYTLVTLVAALVTALLSFGIGEAFASGNGAPISDWSAPEAIIGSVLYVAVLGMMSFGVATIIRNTAGSIMAMIGILLVIPYVVVPILQNNIKSSWPQELNKWLPTSYASGVQMITGRLNGVVLFSPWAQFGVTAAYAAAFLVIGAVLLSRRDA